MLKPLGMWPRPRGLWRCSSLLLFPSLLAAQFGERGQVIAAPPSGDDVYWRQVEELHSGYFSDPTAPVPVEGLILPWEPSEAVVLVLPLSQMRQMPGVQTIVRQMLAALLSEMPVVALYHELDQRLLGDWLLAMEAEPEIGPHLEKVELLSTSAFSIWARDFSPIFARGSDGAPVAVAPSFIAVRRLMDMLGGAKGQFEPEAQQGALIDATRELKGMRGSDAVPAVLAAHLAPRWPQPPAVSRPPLYLLGGDFLPVARDAVLVSALTLAENGGRSQALDRIFAEYFGVSRALYLENLPGDTIEHLDFIVQAMGEDVIFVAAPPAKFGSDRPYHRRLERELAQRLARNRAILEREFPGHRLIDLPTPPPLLDSEETVVDELLRHCIERVAQARRLPFRPIEGALEPDRLEPDLREAVQAELGLYDWSSSSARRSAVQRYLKRPLEPLIERHVEEHVYYRSYVNSLYVRSPKGAEILLVPRYRPAQPGEAELLRRLEVQVEEAYRGAFPEAAFHWIDCTDLASYLGAVHCLTATIPVPGG